MKTNNIEKAVRLFLEIADPIDRCRSYDYCYNYFSKTTDLTKDIEKSCLVLGFYLASWGMFRGSSFLLQKSIKYFEPLIEHLQSLDRSIWEIDVDKYDKENIQKIMGLYHDIKGLLIKGKNADTTLTTKVMLGIFGSIPAYDNYFTDTFRKISNGRSGFRRVNTKSLMVIKDFYEENKPVIDQLSIDTFTVDFKTGAQTTINYTKAKIIDMYGFNVASMAQKNKGV